MPYVAAGWLSLSRSALALGVSASLRGSESPVPAGPHRPGEPRHSYDDVVQVIEDEGVARFEASWNERLDTIKKNMASSPSFASG
jgi:hypothetical protein